MVFLPAIMGISLSSALMASGLGAGGIAHWVTITSKLSEQVQKAIKDSVLSLTSLQCKIISVAQVLWQNGRALALLTADKGGTCMFLGEECCYYIKKSALMETQVKSLQIWVEGLRGHNQPTSSPLLWWQYSPFAWVTPIMGPVVLISLFFLLALCLLHFFQENISEVSGVAVNQMLLHPYLSLRYLEVPAH